ncbi:MAG: PAS-domain containing protein [Rhizomicrobium sp.]
MGFAKAQKVLAPEFGAPDILAPGLADGLDCLRIAITMYDAQGLLTYANRHFDYLFRKLPGRDTLIGLPYREIVRLEIAAGEIAASALAGGEDAFVAARCLQLSSGDYRPVDIALSDGRIVEIKARRAGDGGSIVLWSDVTGPRHALGRLEDAIALSADAFAFFDGTDRLVVCNREFATLYGRPAEALRGTAFRDMLTDAVTRGRVRIEGEPRRLDRAAHGPAQRAGRRHDAGDAVGRRLPGARPPHPPWPRHGADRRDRRAPRRGRAGRADRRAGAHAAGTGAVGDLSCRPDAAAGHGVEQRRPHQEDAAAHDEP